MIFVVDSHVFIPPSPPAYPFPSPPLSTRIQAGVSGLWYKYVGLDGKVVGVDKYGMSAPGDIVMKEYGMTAENLISECKSYM